MKTYLALLAKLEAVMKILAACCLMGMAFLTGADVLGRGGFNTPIFGSEEIVTILATLAVGLSLPYAHSQRVHIGVEIVVRRFSRRTRDIIKLITDLAALALFALVCWRMALYAGTLNRAGTVSMNLELPEYYVVYALGFGFLVFALGIFGDVMRFFSKDGE
ncbi:TRAP transporter small permease [Desulfovibrio ferrophilus]|uniref:Tripartite AtP-independent periplasmic transporter subunit DctQ n=1 Tax=Desulfovibrio ferrophilus TaxID=241368 RepID=A0A2Z6B3I4_9BACT|nr:TRAP transporter small permease [Desulfovibrio ferrophilus]BBD10051.1 tripartite AtP-independent periplasmic transporter subunit DctQ [Desulfovibrio ferrophilus]